MKMIIKDFHPFRISVPDLVGATIKSGHGDSVRVSHNGWGYDVTIGERGYQKLDAGGLCYLLNQWECTAELEV